MQPDFQVSDDPAGRVAALLVEAMGHVVLTGGSTPRRAYERAAEERADWSGVDVWFTDERCVAPDHEHSNFRMVDEALLSRASGARVHRMRGELGPHDGATAYERELAESGPADATFDLMFVGLGADSHICSLFPNDDALGEHERPVVGVQTPGMAPLVSRITLTLPVVNRTREVVFLVTGEEKALAAARAFSGRSDPRYPGSLVEGPVTVLLDPPAAAQL
jgi:6-phosphogluconolactonase